MCLDSAVHHLRSPSGSTGRAKRYSILQQCSTAKVTAEKHKDDRVKSDQNGEMKPEEQGQCTNTKVYKNCSTEIMD